MVKEFKSEDKLACDEKNIRRRAYDALNVLTAMDIISKDKKHIHWRGYSHLLTETPSVAPSASASSGATPSSGASSSERQLLINQIHAKRKELREKEGQLEDVAIQYIGLRRLLDRNDLIKRERTSEAHSSDDLARPLQKIYLPFVLGMYARQFVLDCCHQ